MKRLIVLLLALLIGAFGVADVSNAYQAGYVGRMGPAAVATDPDARALIAAMTVKPPPAQQKLINSTIRSLKAARLWDKSDALWVLAAHDAQAARLNWKDPSLYILTPVNSPTFAAYFGYAGDGATSYLDTGWDPLTKGNQFTLNSSAIAVYVNQTGTAMATIEAGNTNNSLTVRNTGAGNFSARTGDSIPFNGTISATTGLGFTSVNRSSSTQNQFYKNGTQIGPNVTTPTVALTSTTMYIGGRNNAGALSGASNRRLSWVSFSGSLTASEQEQLYAIVLNYMTAVGAQ